MVPVDVTGRAEVRDCVLPGGGVCGVSENHLEGILATGNTGTPVGSWKVEQRVQRG